MFETQKIIETVPHIYNGFIEMESLVNSEDRIWDTAELETVSLWNNQFILTADIKGIEYYEGMIDILANPSIETLEFRRLRLLRRRATKPPFTFRFLKYRLDEIIGVNKWTAYVDFNAYTLYIESVTSDQNWAHEVQVLLNDIKPANIVFVNTPLIKNSIALSEQILYNKLRANYVLGTLWTMGTHPFISMGADEVIKMATIPSLKAALFSDVATFTIGDIDNVLINDDVVITTFTKKTTVDGECQLEYEVPPTATATITNIKIRRADTTVLSEVVVFVPVTDTVLIKHSILVEEGV